MNDLFFALTLDVMRKFAADQRTIYQSFDHIIAISGYVVFAKITRFSGRLDHGVTHGCPLAVDEVLTLVTAKPAMAAVEFAAKGWKAPVRDMAHIAEPNCWNWGRIDELSAVLFEHQTGLKIAMPREMAGRPRTPCTRGRR